MTTIEKEIKKTPNELQQLCINNTKGRYLVLAGPGTGKTFTIIERIKNMLSTGAQANKILCLTYTDAAANEMKKRIEEELGITSCDVQIYTYHSFCCNIIDEYPEEFEIPANYKVISDPISKAFIKECIDEIKPKHFRTKKNDPYYYINTIKNRISAIKQNRLTKEQYFKNIEDNPDWEIEKKRIEDKLIRKRLANDTRTLEDERALDTITKKINQAKELWEFYELYKQKMDDERYLDFNDMINIVLDKFESEPSFLSQIANNYEYIMVDEYQDTNKSQNKIIFALSKALESNNIFVVGDDDQIIYRFQGAKLDTIINYLESFKDTKIICLTDNMRSTQKILDTARLVIEQDPLSLVNNHKIMDINGNVITKNLTAKNEELFEKNNPVRLYKYFDIMQEYTEIVNEIETLINSDDCPKDKKTGEKLLSEIAILTRTNAEAESFGDLLKLKNIPYELKEGRDIFTIPAVNVLYFYIQFLINPDKYAYRIFELLVAPPFNIDPRDYMILYKEASKEDTFIEVLRKTSFEKFHQGAKLENFLYTFDYLSEYKNKETIKNTILEIGAKTGIFDYYLNGEINRTENIAGIKRFVEEATGFAQISKTNTLEEFCLYLKAITEDDETIKTEKAPITLNAIQLCTYHSSKGREFEYVYMPTMISEKWESSRQSLKPDIPLDKSEYKSAEEIKAEIKPSDLTKLLYVAMTRAKHTLRMSYPEQIERKNKRLTKFLSGENFDKVFEKEKEPFQCDEKSYFEQALHLIIKKEYDYKKEFKDFILSRLQDKPFSPSAINNYLGCPRKYFYQNILKFEIKDGNPNNLSYGSAVHKACEKAVKFIKNNNCAPDKTQFIQWFKDELSNLNMTTKPQRENFTGRGEKALDKFYSQITNLTPNSLCEAEYELEYTMEDGTKFFGIIDRIDKNEDGTYSLYDYKTGDNKNSGIKVGGDHEDYYNQMAWYKYFYEQKTKNKVSVTKFIYPEDFEKTNNGINYTQDEINDAVATFKQAVADIKDCKFEPSYDKKSCQYCDFKDFCKMNLM